MFHKIRSLLEQDELFYDGTVEVDEAYFGGQAKWRNRGVARNIGRGTANKTPVLGMAQRGKDGEHGRIIAKVVPDASEWSLMPQVRTKVVPPSVVYTDEHRAYNSLGEVGYKHERVEHSKKVYVSGDVHTNTIEGFWSHIKRGVSGVYRGVSTKHLQSYLDEYVFRYNNRGDERGIFMAFLDRIEKDSPGPGVS